MGGKANIFHLSVSGFPPPAVATQLLEMKRYSDKFVFLIKHMRLDTSIMSRPNYQAKVRILSWAFLSNLPPNSHLTAA